MKEKEKKRFTESNENSTHRNLIPLVCALGRSDFAFGSTDVKKFKRRNFYHDWSYRQ
jgi:hypothetical protein